MAVTDLADRIDELEDENAALRGTVIDYLAKLDWSRQPYRQTARNAPSAEQVRSRKRQALAAAEARLREAVADG